MAKKAVFLRRADINHLLRAAASITQLDSFVLVGTGAVIAQLKTVPLSLMQTREIDIYADLAADPDTISDLIDGSIGEGSQFDLTFGYYAHGVGERTACLPDDWRDRAVSADLAASPPITCTCPDVNDIALSKLCAWRDKDRAWLVAGLSSGVLDLAAMAARAARISNPNAPGAEEIRRRLAVLGDPAKLP